MVFDIIAGSIILFLCLVGFIFALSEGEDNKPSKANTLGERSIVNVRYVGGVYAAMHWDSEVWYDSWGTPFAIDKRYGGTLNELKLKPDGSTASLYTEWRLASGPELTFPDEDATSRGWYPQEAK